MKADYVVNPYIFLARISPTEILLGKGLFSKTYIVLSSDSPDKCDRLESLFKERTSTPSGIEELKTDLINCGIEEAKINVLLENAVFVPVDCAPVKFLYPDLIERQQRKLLLVSDEQGLSKAIEENLNTLGIAFERRGLSHLNSLKLAQGRELSDIVLSIILNCWNPLLLREGEKLSHELNVDFMPVYLVPDGSVIGPYVKPKKTATYTSFERQLEANMVSWMVHRTYRDFLLNKPSPFRPGTLPRPFIELVAGLASILIVYTVFHGEEMLLNRAVVIDFSSLFIDTVRVYREPSDWLDVPVGRSEF